MANTGHYELPVTMLEALPGGRVRVTAEWPMVNQPTWAKVQFIVVLANQPNLGDKVTVSISV